MCSISEARNGRLRPSQNLGDERLVGCQCSHFIDDDALDLRRW